MGAALELQGVSKRFGTRSALADISLSVPEGAFVCVFGPNGAGKTTLLRLMATLARPTEGKVALQGVDALEHPEQVRALIGLVSHSPLLYPELTAYENLKLFAQLYGVKNADARVEKLLRDVGLYHRRFDAVSSYSRGMTQRLSIARALVNDPAILLLDEPYSGLDPYAADDLDGILARERKGRTIVMVSHDLEKGYGLCTHLLVLAKGKVKLFCSREEMAGVSFEQVYRESVGRGGA